MPFATLGSNLALAFGISFIALAVAFKGYHWWASNEIETLRSNAASLTFAVEEQKRTINQQLDDIVAKEVSIKKLQRDFASAREDVTRLDKKFNKVTAAGVRDLGVIAMAKPNLLEKVIRNGTVNANRCHEILSGAPLTEDELNAEKRSEINPECPDLANPNFRD